MSDMKPKKTTSASLEDEALVIEICRDLNDLGDADLSIIEEAVRRQRLRRELMK